MTVKTAISVDRDLFAEADALAATLAVSRSELYSLALRDYVRRQRQRATIERLNRVHADAAAGAGETALARAHRPAHRRLVEGTW
jgi:metal-responsive CopG/Arc/MetJ family transcriptional regulator